MLTHCSNPECTLQFADSIETCPSCGHARGESVVHSSLQIEPSAASPFDSLANTSIPVAWQCPQCGDPQSFVTSTGAAFTVRHPRQCVSCRTIYFRPTGRIVSLLLLTTGLLLTLGAAYACVDLARQGNLLAVLTNSPIILVGIVTSCFGFRFLFAGPETSNNETQMDHVHAD